MNRNIKRKGFTLVELLIVIVVIGILSAMMMLSSTEAVTSAKASNIVSNLRNFKTAALALYVDYYDSMDQGQSPSNSATAGSTSHDLLVKYMNKGSNNNVNGADTDKYHLHLVAATGTTPAKWYVVCTDTSDERVRNKLAGRAKSVGLLNDSFGDYAGTGNVYMFVTNSGN